MSVKNDVFTLNYPTQIFLLFFKFLISLFSSLHKVLRSSEWVKCFQGNRGGELQMSRCRALFRSKLIFFSSEMHQQQKKKKKIAASDNSEKTCQSDCWRAAPAVFGRDVFSACHFQILRRALCVRRRFTNCLTAGCKAVWGSVSADSWTQDFQMDDSLSCTLVGAGGGVAPRLWLQKLMSVFDSGLTRTFIERRAFVPSELHLLKTFINLSVLSLGCTVHPLVWYALL